MDHRTVGVVLTILGLAAATQGQAQEEEPDVVKFTLDAGFASTSGNSNITTITGGQAFSYTAGHFVFSQAFDVLFNQTDDSTTAEAYKGNVRGDRTLGSAERLSVFLDLRGSRNRFAGISRRFEQALGVAYDVIKTEKDIVAVEGAATLVQQRGTNGVDNNFPAALAGASYLHHFTPDATFTVKGELPIDRRGQNPSSPERQVCDRSDIPGPVRQPPRARVPEDRQVFYYWDTD